MMAEPRIPAAVHRAHPAGADLRVDPVRPERRADQRAPVAAAAGSHRAGEQRAARRAAREVGVGGRVIGEAAGGEREQLVLRQAAAGRRRGARARIGAGHGLLYRVTAP
jgi:hypothetical protein